MEDSSELKLVLSDSDEDIDFTRKRKLCKQSLRIDESDISESESNSTGLKERLSQSNDQNISERSSNESKDSDNDSDISFSMRRKKRRKKRSDEVIDFAIYFQF